VTQIDPREPIALELFRLAWERTLADLPAPLRPDVGPASQDEYLALLKTLATLAGGIEANLIVTMEQAANVFHVSHADIGRACGISRQAVRQRLLRIEAETAKRRKQVYDSDHYIDDYFEAE
jgi:hypothetical protein